MEVVFYNQVIQKSVEPTVKLSTTKLSKLVLTIALQVVITVTPRCMILVTILVERMEQSTFGLLSVFPSESWDLTKEHILETT